jgi:hypothetical protein
MGRAVKGLGRTAKVIPGKLITVTNDLRAVAKQLHAESRSRLLAARAKGDLRWLIVRRKQVVAVAKHLHGLR